MYDLVLFVLGVALAEVATTTRLRDWSWHAVIITLTLTIVAVAGTAWAIYQAVIGAAIGALLPHDPLIAVILSIVVAIALGAVIDVVVARVSGRRRA